MTAIKNKTATVPKLRFGEFEGEWEQIKLQKNYVLISGQHLNPNEYTESKNDRLNPYFTGPSDFTNDKKDIKKWAIVERKEAKKNDILITVKGNGVGKMMLLNLPNITIGRQLMAIRSSSASIGLVYFYLETQKKKLESLASGNLIPGLSRNDILTLKLNLPTLAEQKKIATFLSAIDKKISQLTQKVSLLEQYKKGVLQQVFSQQIRFKDDDGGSFPDWEEKRLGEVAIFLDNKRKPLSQLDRQKRQGVYPYYGASGIIDYIDDYIFDGEYILLGEDGANIVTRSTRLAFIAKGKIWVNNHAHVLQAKESSYFLAESLERIRYDKYNTGTAQPKLNSEVCKKLPLNMPCLQEQKKIANFLSQLDAKINQSQAQLDQQQAYKQGLLQQLFI